MTTFIKSISHKKNIPDLQKSDNTLETWQDMSDHSLSLDHDFPEGEESMSALLFKEEREEAAVQHSSKDEKTLVDGGDDEYELSSSQLYFQMDPNHHEEESSSATRTLYDYHGDDAKDIDLKSEQSPRRRRSSMKQGLGRRRASLCIGEEIEVDLPGNSTPVKRRSSITFCKEVHMTSVVPVLEMVDKVEDLWFRSEDLDYILERSYALVDRAAEGKAQYCTRGLESLSIDADTFKDAIDTVLSIQDVQWDHGRRCEKTISQLYSLSSMDSKIAARMRAKEDVKAVENYLKETRKSCRRLSL